MSLSTMSDLTEICFPAAIEGNVIVPIENLAFPPRNKAKAIPKKHFVSEEENNCEEINLTR